MYFLTSDSFLASSHGDGLDLCNEVVQKLRASALLSEDDDPWPECPQHLGAHALEIRRETDLFWFCPETGERIAAVGALSDSTV